MSVNKKTRITKTLVLPLNKLLYTTVQLSIHYQYLYLLKPISYPMCNHRYAFFNPLLQDILCKK